jgi:hypothetical protein
LTLEYAEDFKYFSDLPHVTHLKLNSRVYNVRDISELSGLRSLNITFSQNIFKRPVPNTRFPNLLKLDTNRFTPPILFTPQLEELMLSGSSAPAGFRLSTLTSLRSLCIHPNSLQPSEFSHLQNLEELHLSLAVVEAQDPDPPRNPLPFSRFPKLQWLSMYSHVADWNDLANMTQLTCLHLFDSRQPLVQDGDLALLTNLRTLKLFYTSHVTKIKNLTNLTELYLNFLPPIKISTKLSSLSSLTIESCDGFSLSQLQRLTKLTSLQYSAHHVQREVLLGLTNLTSLQIVDYSI